MVFVLLFFLPQFFFLRCLRKAMFRDCVTCIFFRWIMTALIGRSGFTDRSMSEVSGTFSQVVIHMQMKRKYAIFVFTLNIA